VRHVPISAITASQRNPRRKLTGLAELAASVREHGLLQPVVVRALGDGYELMAGHRRVEAARQLGWATIPALVRPETADEGYILTLVENLQREDLSPREEAQALEVLLRQRQWSTRQVASAIHRSQAFVSKRLRVFEDPILAPAVLADQLSVSAAEELLAAPERRRYEILAQAIQGGWDRGQVRRAIREAGGAPARSRRPRGLTRRIRQLRTDVRDLRPEDLTELDRRELRLLFSELAMLARARPGARPVIPPLPVTPRSRQR
jgi:ParB family chromosome partitioning protein